MALNNSKGTWSGVHKKTVEERVSLVKSHVNLNNVSTSFADGIDKISNSHNISVLTLDTADCMTENCIGIGPMPVGINPYYKINGKDLCVPFMCEETSVVASNCGATKKIGENGGFKASYSGNIMTGQIQILFQSSNSNNDIPIIDESFFTKYNIIQFLTKNNSKYINIANKNFCQSMYNRGGGMKSIEYRIIHPRNINTNNSNSNINTNQTDSDIKQRRRQQQQQQQQQPRSCYLVMQVGVDVCEAMGANTVNGVCEGLAKIVEKDLKEYLIETDRSLSITPKIGLKILSNLCTNRIAKCQFSIPFSKLGYKNVEGSIVAERILNAYYFALDDEYRAVTNNKGIMNGIDSVCIALGQDFRAIEASSHGYTVFKNGFYAPMARYEIVEYRVDTEEEGNENENEQCLVGSLELPIAVGTKGGSISVNPFSKLMLELVCSQGYPCTAEGIAKCLVCVGLAQNFAALRAMVTEGIQKGHMSLHARNIAISAGVPRKFIQSVVKQMIDQELQINKQNAKNVYEKIKNNFNLKSSL